MWRVWRGYAAATNTTAVLDKMAADLNKIAIPGMIVQFPGFFYSVYKKKNFLEETIIQCIYLDWKYTASVIRSAIIM